MFFRSTEHMLSLRPKASGLHRPAKAACKSKQRKEKEKIPQDIDILAGEESSFIYLHLKGHCVLCSIFFILSCSLTLKLTFSSKERPEQILKKRQKVEEIMTAELT